MHAYSVVLICSVYRQYTGKRRAENVHKDYLYSYFQHGMKGRKYVNKNAYLLQKPYVNVVTERDVMKKILLLSSRILTAVPQRLIHTHT